MRPYGSQESLERRRFKAADLFGQGVGATEVARRLGVDPRTARGWKARWRARGRRGLAKQPVPGAPPKLDARGRQRLRRALLKGAKKAGFPSDLWTCRRVARWLREHLGVVYHPHHLPRVLKALGFTPQKPQRKAAERDEAAVRVWVAREWPRIKKGRGGQGHG